MIEYIGDIASAVIAGVAVIYVLRQDARRRRRRIWEKIEKMEERLRVLGR